MAEKPVLWLTRRLPEAVEARAARDYEAVLNPEDVQYDAAAIIERSQDMDAILTCATERFDAAVIEKLARRVRVVATYSVGYEHIDTETATRRELLVTNTPDVLTAATADLTLLLILGAARRAHEWGSLLRDGRWGRWNAIDLLGTDVTGRRLGIFGMGRIGQAVAERASGFRMKIHYHNRNRLAPEIEGDAVWHDNVESLLGVSEILSLNSPSTPETEGFLDARRIALLPDSAIVINSSRGNVIDDDALIAALKDGKLAAAGLDVFAGEPMLDPRYLGLPNAFLMPHIGSATLETRNAMGFRALDNIDAVFAGREPPDRIA